MRNVPESDESLYFGSPVGKVALSRYEPCFWLSLMLTDALPVASVVPTAVWDPTANVTFRPTTASPYSSTRLAVRTMVLDGLDDSGPVYPSVVSRFVTTTVRLSLSHPPFLSQTSSVATYVPGEAYAWRTLGPPD